MSQQDQEILKLLLQRDPVLLRSFFEEANPYLLKLLATNKLFGDEAQELVQSAWETFFKSLDRFQGRSQLKVFLAGILINKLREYRRYQKKNVLEEDLEKLVDQRFSHDGWWNSESEDPEKIFQSKKIQEFITDCLEGLTDNQRQAFVLKEVQDEPSAEICNILGVTVTNLGVLLFRAKDKLRKCLEGKVQPEYL